MDRGSPHAKDLPPCPDKPRSNTSPLHDDIHDASTLKHNYNTTTHERHDDNNTVAPDGTPTAAFVETWQFPRINTYRCAAVFSAFLMMGLSDGSIGVIIPYLESYYNVSYLVVSLVFLSPFVGYTVGAFVNNSIHLRFGQRGIAFLAPSSYGLAYVVICTHPPYPVLVLVFLLMGLGSGLTDAAWNAWIGAMDNANEVLGLLHGVYGLGAAIAPLCTSAMITKAGLPWYYWYYCMVGAAVVTLVTSLHSFWAATGQAFRLKACQPSNRGLLKEAILTQPAARVTWLMAFFLFGYVGMEVAIGGWVVTFMIRVRHAKPFASGITATGFWLGITVGRMILGFITPRLGEKRAIAIYLPLALGCELLFWLVPSFVVGAVAVAFVGFFLGPLFPSAVVACAKLLPTHLHISAIGFAAALGGSGGGLLPFAVGALAQAKGPGVLQPVIVALMVVTWGLWMCLPSIEERHIKPTSMARKFKEHQECTAEADLTTGKLPEHATAPVLVHKEAYMANT